MIEKNNRFQIEINMVKQGKRGFITQKIFRHFFFNKKTCQFLNKSPQKNVFLHGIKTYLEEELAP